MPEWAGARTGAAVNGATEQNEPSRSNDRQVIVQGRDELDLPRGTALTITSGPF